MPESNPIFIEHRKFIRLLASDVGRLTCTIPLGLEQTIALESTDISPGGFGAIIPDGYLENFRQGSEFSHCQINLPGMVNLSVRLVELWQLKKNDGEPSTFAGFEFTSPLDWLSTGLESCVMPD